MKKLIEKSYGNTKQRITQYLITKLKEYQERQNGIKSETVSYLFNPVTNEFVLDNKDNIWTMTSDIKLAKEFDKNNMINNLILKTYNFNKPDNEKLRWMTMIKLSGFNVNLTPVLQINDDKNNDVDSKIDQSKVKDFSLAELDKLHMDNFQ